MKLSRSTEFVLIICCVLFSVATVAQTTAVSSLSPALCSPAGTWYGGSDVKYLLTIAPTGPNTFSVRAEVLLALGDLGLPAWTSWSGEFKKSKPGLFVGQYISLYTTSSEVPPPPDSYELDAVRAYLKFSDCDNINITYDFYGVYFDLAKVPFLEVPDISVDTTGMSETYRRMPTSCTVCGSLLSTFRSGRMKH